MAKDKKQKRKELRAEIERLKKDNRGREMLLQKAERRILTMSAKQSETKADFDRAVEVIEEYKTALAKEKADRKAESENKKLQLLKDINGHKSEIKFLNDKFQSYQEYATRRAREIFAGRVTEIFNKGEFITLTALIDALADECKRPQNTEPCNCPCHQGADPCEQCCQGPADPAPPKPKFPENTTWPAPAMAPVENPGCSGCQGITALQARNMNWPDHCLTCGRRYL
jgi:hypothetical protein